MKAALSPVVPAELEASYRAGPTLALRQPLVNEGETVPADCMPPLTNQPLAHGGVRPSPPQVLLASAKGFTSSAALSAEQAVDPRRALTRRAVLEEAFSHMGEPYGWGDEHGGRDCSRLLLDVLARFAVHLPRTSGEQGRAGQYTLEIPAEANETERLGLLDAAQSRGVVLVHLPGHIMLYLGRDHAGVPRVLHSFAEYLAPCAGGGETLFEVGRVGVTDLSLGQGTSRRSFLERITRLSVLGKPPGHELLAFAQFRRSLPPTAVPARCHDSTELALFRSPRAPHAKTPLRVIAVTREDTRPAGLWLIDPKGALIAAPIQELGVGPYARWVQVDAPLPGRWTALLADGERVLSCERFRVAPKPEVTAPAEPRPAEAAAWASSIAWERDTENLYAAFVEQLFSEPVGQLGSWKSLTPLLADPARNLLFNHLGLQEESKLTLAPDCADLPYFLRAYFAWKMGLPFAFRPCSRGKSGVAPRCGELVTNALPMSAENDVDAFTRFLREHVAAGVHSASARTLPEDEASDLYPLPLTREALKPGSVFADPYGHTIVVAQWVPQGWHGAGLLIGADAQPDATVARRRFWRGNFLFSPETRDVGAGFKGFRPLIHDPDTGLLTALDAKAIAANPNFAAPSLAQYAGSQDDFYTRMDELIYPRPVALSDRLEQLVAALHEQVERRVEAVQVGEAGLASQARPVAMPEGYALFETTGPWEDFATPSRDMRLLIAIDAVRSLPEDVRARPLRYGLSTASVQAATDGLAKALTATLGARRFRYTRSDGSPFELSLADLLARSEALESAYNPNDCPELRWGAPAASPERATCQRSAPPEQQALMESYRSWFRARTRPARP